MPRKTRRRKIPTPEWERHHTAIGRTVLGRSTQVYATIGVVLLVIAALGVVAYSVAAHEIEKRNRPNATALQIDDKKFTLSYYSNRLKTYVQQSGGTLTKTNATQVLPGFSSTLVDEETVRRFAPGEGVSASEDDIKSEIATRLGITKDDANFQSRFQGELAKTGLSEDQYREMITATVLRKNLLDKYAAEVPATAESIHYRQIIVQDQATADKLAAQIDGGADFAQLAKDNSIEQSTKTNGGDAGWVPRGFLNKSIEDQLFPLDVNKVITYSIQNQSGVYEVLEKDPAHAVDDKGKSTLAQKKVADWLKAKQGGLNVQDSVLNNQDYQTYVEDHAFPSA